MNTYPFERKQERKLDFLVSLVKESRKFQGIDDALVKQEILKELHKKRAYQGIVGRSHERSLERNKTIKTIIRRVRASLFLLHGAYYGKRSDLRYKLLEKLQKNIHADEEKVVELHKRILHCHTSTRERMSFYEDLYHALFQLIGKPQSILDVGCGLNPVSYPFMHLKDVAYTASDFSQRDCDFVKNYFDLLTKRYPVHGEVICINVLDDEGIAALKRLPAVDVCFLFKVSDLIDRKGHKPTEKVVQAVHAKYVIVSFSTKTLSGQLMEKRRRVWFETMIERLGYSFEIVEKQNELFYVIKK